MGEWGSSRGGRTISGPRVFATASLDETPTKTLLNPPQFLAFGSRGLVYKISEPNNETTVAKYYFAGSTTCFTNTTVIVSRPTCYIDDLGSFLSYLRQLSLRKFVDDDVPFPSEEDFFNASHWPNSTQLQSPTNVNDEWTMNAKAAAAPMTMGVSVAISRRLIRLPAHYNNSLALNCSCCDHYNNCKVNFVSTMYLVVEILLFFPFTAQQLFNDGRLRDDDSICPVHQLVE
jgi:hypothetical protein